MSPDLMKFFTNSMGYYLVPVCIDIVIISYLIKIRSKERLILAALISNALVFLGRKGFTKLITNIIQPFFVNSGSDLQMKYMGVIEKGGVQLIIIIGILIAIAIRIPFYKKYITDVSTRDISLAVFISTLISEVIISVGLFIFLYNIHP